MVHDFCFSLKYTHTHTGCEQWTAHIDWYGIPTQTGGNNNNSKQQTAAQVKKKQNLTEGECFWMTADDSQNMPFFLRTLLSSCILSFGISLHKNYNHNG